MNKRRKRAFLCYNWVNLVKKSRFHGFLAVILEEELDLF
jgi:hypothetical protein